MFGIFKKRPSEPISRPASRNFAAPSRKPAPSLWEQPAKLPEVTEGNSDADWAAWEDSVAFQDSQMPPQCDAPTVPMQLNSTSESERDSAFDQEAMRKNR